MKIITLMESIFWKQRGSKLSAFQNEDRFPFVKLLESNWEIILEEYRKVKELSSPYPEHDLYGGHWDVIPFMFFEDTFEEICTKCPKTWDILQNIPGLVTASFSIMKPNTEIHPHTGFTNKVFRCHFGLEIPDNCAIIVGGEPKLWEQGKCFIFDDTVEHSAYNRSNHERVVLLIDVERP